jgi:hypothetical protein
MTKKKGFAGHLSGKNSQKCKAKTDDLAKASSP